MILSLSLSLSQFSVNVYNPLVRPVSWPVRLPVNGTSYEVSDAEGRPVDCQVCVCVCVCVLVHKAVLGVWVKFPLPVVCRWSRCPRLRAPCGGSAASPWASWCSWLALLRWASPPTPCPGSGPGRRPPPCGATRPPPSRTRSDWCIMGEPAAFIILL